MVSPLIRFKCALAKDCSFSLGALTLKLNIDILAPLIEKLTNLKTKNSVDSSITFTALRTLILAFPQPVIGVTPSKATQDGYAAISKVLIPRLVGYVVLPHGIKNQPDPPPGMLSIDPEKGVNSDAIDVLVELIRWFGPMLHDGEKQSLQIEVVKIFDNERNSTVIKKKAVVAISILAVYLSDRLLSNFISSITTSFQDVHLTLAKRRLLITMVGSLARSIPQRLGPYLKSLAPFILSALSEEEFDQAMEELAEAGAPNPEVEEVREAALVTLEGFLSSCSNEMRSFTEQSIAAATRYVTYDPNHATNDYQDDEEMGGTQADDSDDAESENLGADDENEEDFEEEGALSDDDDSSWKVRRCAAKALYTIISTRSNGDLLDNGVLYRKIAPVLIGCFKEREENVRLEVLNALASLIRKTSEGISLSSTNSDSELGITPPCASQSRKRRRGSSDANSFDSLGNASSSGEISSPAASPSPLSGPRADLARLSPTIIRGVAKLLKSSSIPTKQAAITVLLHIVLVQHGGLSENIDKIADPLVDAVKLPTSYAAASSAFMSGAASGSKLRIDALQLVSAIYETHPHKVLSPHTVHIVPVVITAINDKQYKVSSEAIHVAESLIKVLTPPRCAGTDQQSMGFLSGIHAAILDRAVAIDADLEVRQRAIHSLGFFLARTSCLNTPKALSTVQKSNALNVLQERLKNETTRLSAVQAVDLVCASTNRQDDLQPDWVRNVALELGAQLRKADRVLRGSSLGALKNLTSKPVLLGLLDEETVRHLSGMLLPLLTTNDLNLLSTALMILSRLVSHSPRKVVDEQLNAALCRIVLSPLSGVVMDNFLHLIKDIGEQGVGQLLMQSLLRNIGVAGDPAIVGKAIGVLLVSGSSTVGVKLDDFATELRSSVDVQRKCLALSVLGEAGLRLGDSSPLQPSLFTNHFSSKTDQIQRAAATALGRAGAGNINIFLPVILSTTSLSGGSQYLSLHAIKEILQYASKAKADISPYTKQIWEKLLIASQGEDNKAVGAECIGRLAIIEPQTFLPLLQVRSHSTSLILFPNVTVP